MHNGQQLVQPSARLALYVESGEHTFLLTDLTRSVGLNEDGPPLLFCCELEYRLGDGSCDVDAMSPTTTHVDNDRDVLPNLPCMVVAISSTSELMRNLLMASSDALCGKRMSSLSESKFVTSAMSLVLKLLDSPSADCSAPQLLIKSFSSSNHAEFVMS
jgi:hypothetical protein